MKYCRLAKDYQTGNDIQLFDILGRGMCKALKQNLQHWFDLINTGSLHLERETKESTDIIEWKHRNLISLCICSSEYRFLTSHIISNKIIQALRYGEIGTYSPDKTDEISNFKKSQDQIRNIVNAFEKKGYDDKLGKIFFNTLFLSAPEIYMMCQQKNVSFVKQLKQLISANFGTLDPYVELILYQRLLTM